MAFKTHSINKLLFFPLLFLGIHACSNSQNTDQKSDITRTDNQELVESKKIQFNNLTEKAVLIGEEITLLDSKLSSIKDITHWNGEIVDVIGVSDSLFNASEYICNAYWYVKIIVGDKEGVVNGRKVFRIIESEPTKSFTIKGNLIEIYKSHYYGMGITHEEDLVGCDIDKPVVLKDTANSYFGLVDLIQNEYSKQASWETAYPFFELIEDDGGYDRIDSVIFEGTKIRLKIQREFQEGMNESEVILSYSDNKYTAKYLNFGETKYFFAQDN